MNTPYYIKLKNRALLHIEGKDRIEFLQALITNDMNKLSDGKILYACLLTPQGKFLHDFFIQAGTDFLLLDCESGKDGVRARDLAQRLSMYKLRKDVQISVEESSDVYAIFGAPNIGLADPRHEDMGTRVFEKPAPLLEEEFDTWDTLRISLTIPDGSRDLIINKSTMDEAHMDQLGAVDFDKGCYIGQELTARMHYRGIGKKHLQTVKLSNIPEGSELRSNCGTLGLALVKG